MDDLNNEDNPEISRFIWAKCHIKLTHAIYIDMVAFVQNIILDVQILNAIVLKIKDIDIDIFSVTNFFNVILFTLYVSSSVIPNSC